MQIVSNLREFVLSVLQRPVVVKRIAIAVVITFFLLAFALAYSAAGFMNLTSTKFVPNSNSRESTWARFTTRFLAGPQVSYNGFYIIVSTNNQSEPLTTPCRTAVLKEYVEAFALTEMIFGNLTCVSSFFTPQCVYPTVPPESYLLDNGSTALISSSIYFGSDPPEEADFLSSFPLQPFFDNSSCPTQITVQHTGLLEMVDSLKDSVVGDLESIDSFALPIAFLLVAMCTSSLRSILIPFTMVVITVIITFAILNPIAHHVVFITVCPEVIIAMSAALSVDYCLFLLTRFRDIRQAELERLRRQSGASVGGINASTNIFVHSHDEDAAASDRAAAKTDAELESSPQFRILIIQRAVFSCVTNISFSACTIVGVYLSLLLNVSDLIRGMAIGCSISAAVCGITSMTFTPCYMYLLYGYLTSHVACLDRMGKVFDAFCDTIYGWTLGRCFGANANDDADDQSAGEAVQKTETDSLISSSTNRKGSSYEATALRSQRSSPWFHVADLVTRWPSVTLLFCLLLLIPFLLILLPWNKTTAKGLNLGFDIFEEVPTNAPPTVTYHTTFQRFPAMLSPPFYILFEFCNESVGFNCTIQEWQYNAMQTVYDKLVRDQNSSTTNHLVAQIISPTVDVNGALVSYEDALQRNCFFLDNESVTPYCRQWTMLMNGANMNSTSCGIIAILTSQDSMSSVGEEMFDYLETIRKDFQHLYPENFFFGYFGSDLDSYGCMREVYGTMWWSLGCAVAVVVIAMLITFRSPLLSIRLVFTIAYTMIISFGATTLIYCYTFSHHNGIGGIPGLIGVSSIQWVIPIIVAPLIAALAVDYDAFLLSRFFQLRSQSFTSKAAMIKSVYSTGRVITFAAGIMVVAFGTLTLSHVIMLQQFGMFVLVGVVVDATIVRCALVPALLTLWPQGMWWPRAMAKEELDVNFVSLDE